MILSLPLFYLLWDGTSLCPLLGIFDDIVILLASFPNQIFVFHFLNFLVINLAVR